MLKKVQRPGGSRKVVLTEVFPGSAGRCWGDTNLLLWLLWLQRLVR